MQWLLLILIIPYIYLLILIYRSLTQIKSYQPHPVQDAFLSVVVACRNEEKNLPVLLKHLSGQDYNPDLFEVILIDDNSSDSTLLAASDFKGIRNLIVLRNSGKGKKAAVRNGVATSTGNLIITTDADCRMGHNWLKTIASFFEENKPEMIICPVELESGKGFFQRFQELEFLSLQGITAGTAFSQRPVMCNGANMAFTKEVYNRHMGDLHDELITGDDVFLLHAIKGEPENKIMWLESAEAKVTTNTSETVYSFLKQRARWVSKAGAYKDTSTQVLEIVTFVTILLQFSLLITGIFNPVFLWIFLVAFLLKSVPDYLILQNTTTRYGRKSLMKLFLPGQLIYPVYVLVVFFYFLISKK
jgi:cellulose synthase/poly-beta-1,6-N-acetylglucosamine synthase-like glycosyltransferase